MSAVRGDCSNLKPDNGWLFLISTKQLVVIRQSKRFIIRFTDWRFSLHCLKLIAFFWTCQLKRCWVEKPRVMLFMFSFCKTKYTQRVVPSQIFICNIFSFSPDKDHEGASIRYTLKFRWDIIIFRSCTKAGRSKDTIQYSTRKLCERMWMTTF